MSGTRGIMPNVTVELRVPVAAGRSALLLRPWVAMDMAALVAEMGRESPTRGLWPTPPRGEQVGQKETAEISYWTAVQFRGRGAAVSPAVRS